MLMTKLSTTLAGIAILAMVTVTGGTPAAQCTGNACSSVLFEIDGGCATATNLGGKTIIVEWGGHELKVGAGESKAVKQGGRCIENVGGPISANFA